MAYQPGDILLVRNVTPGSDLLGNLIMAGERARYGNSDYARWTHCALIVSETGDLVEALAKGIARTNVSKYANVETLVISRPGWGAGKRGFAISFALAHVGDRYDLIDFGTLALQALTGCDVSLHSDQRFICSGLVSRATESYTASGYPYPTEQMTPADIGDYWRALSGQKLPSLSLVGRTLDKVRALAWALNPFTKGLRP
jgi:hypothetical protein